MRIHRADQHPSSRGAAFPLTPLRARLWGSAGAGGVRVDELVADGGVGGALVAQVGHAPLLEGGGGFDLHNDAGDGSVDWLAGGGEAAQ